MRLYGHLKKSIESLSFGESLRAKVFRGGVWLGIGSFVEQLCRFARNMILARLLAPDAFGTMAIVLSAGSVADVLTEIGIREAVIQNPRGDEVDYLNAAWWLALGRGIPLYSAIFILAPWIARFYRNAELTPLLRVTLLSIMFYSLISPGIYRALKQMKFRQWAAINHGGGICGVLFTVLLGFFIRDVWALVLGYVAEGVSRCLLSYIICPYLPSIRLDKKAARQLLRFSKGLFGLSFLNLIFIRTDIFVLGKLYSSAELGLYAMAVYLAQTPTSFLMNMLGQTLLPSFSQVQGDNARINRILQQVTSLIVLLSMPTIVFLFFCGHPLLALVYGRRYSAASSALVAASCVALVNLVNGQITTVFYAKGQPQLHRRCVAIMAIMMIVLIYPFIKEFGPLGGQLACLSSIVIGYLFQVVRIRHFTGLDLSRLGKSFLDSAGPAASVAVFSLGIRYFAVREQLLPNILAGVAGCLVAYGLACMIFLRTREQLA